MPEKTSRQFGLWESPITPRMLAEGRRLESAAWDSDGQTLVWLEGRSGQGVLVARSAPTDAPRDLTGELSVRAEVGYGGGDFTVDGGCVYFVVHRDGRIHRQLLSGGPAKAITPAFGKTASPAASPDGKWVAYVHQDGDEIDRIGIVDAEGTHWPQILVEGNDFYMQPRWSPDGRYFCWIAWDHPNMPWDGTLLYSAPVIQRAGRFPELGQPQVIAGGPEISVFQPEFTPDGRGLVYVSDETGWWRIALVDMESGRSRWLTSEGAEYGAPAWVQDMRTYALSADGRYVVAARNHGGFQRVERIDLETAERTPEDGLSDYTAVAGIAAAPTGDRIAMVASGPATPSRVVEHDFAAGETRIVARSSGETIRTAALARCEAVSWTTADGDRCHGIFYPPSSDRFEGAGKPPLIVHVHGGPTSQAKPGWSPDAQYFATRGYAVLLVNYRGSTGYGRAYMLQLRRRWGICDVEDSISGARRLADAGKADPERTVIMGGSAGGFTVLQTMVQHPQAFAAGICLYGVANQFHLASETHKFEARYLDSLLGPLPEAAAVYRERSPLFRADCIRRPLAIFQGDFDRVVPREQSDTIVEALRKSGTPHVYHVYEGEGHGWRKRETIEHFYDAVDRFLRQYVVFA